MANKRIKDLGTTASTLAADDYVAIDGNANGTRKIVKGDLVNDISTQVAGTYLDEANNLSDVASKDTSKLNLEVPDVGTAPNEVPLSGQLGTMAFQDASGVSVSELQVESTTGTGTTEALTVTDGSTTNLSVQEDGKLSVQGKVNLNTNGTVNWGTNIGRLTWETGKAVVRGDVGNKLSLGSNGTQDHLVVDTSGSVGIGTASPGTNANGSADDLVVGNGAEHGITIYSGSSNSGRLFFSDGTGTSTYRGYLRYNHGSNSMVFGTNSSQRAVIDSSGRLGVNNTSPGSYSGAANNLVVGSGSGAEGITIATGAASQGGIYFADGTSGGDMYSGSIIYQHSDDSLRFSTNATTRWQISSAGHLISNNGLYGIDFGSSDILDTYEEGTFTPELADTDTGGNVATTTNANGYYTRVGNLVHITLRLTNIVTTGMTTSNRMRIRNLPFDFDANLNFSPGSIIVDGITYSGMIVPTNVGGVGDNILTLTNFASGGDTYVLISAISSGTADIYINMSYTTDEA